MVHIVVYTSGGGIFAIFHLAIEKILGSYNTVDTIDSFKIRISSDHFFKNKELFDHFFEDTQYSSDDIVTIDESSPNVRFLKAWESPYYSTIKSLLYKNKIHPSITRVVDAYTNTFKIDENTLAVHIRLTDMNIYHKYDHGYRDFNDFRVHIDQMIEKYPNINSLYVCSDNDESIQKLISIYPNYPIHYIVNKHRGEKEDTDIIKYVYQNYNDIENFETDLFTELLIASRCSYFICRISDFANFAILYSDTFKVIDCIN